MKESIKKMKMQKRKVVVSNNTANMDTLTTNFKVGSVEAPGANIGNYELFTGKRSSNSQLKIKNR